MASLHYLVGTWKCTYQAGAVHATYQATFAYAMGANWMRERDVWRGGGGDEALLTYEPKTRAWTEAVFEADRTITVFRAHGTSAEHVVYRSILPDTKYTDVFDWVSSTKYQLHFSQIAGGKTTKSLDTCSKAAQ